MWRCCWSFFMGRASFIISLFHVVRQSMDNFTWMSWRVLGGKAKEEAWGVEKQDLEAAPRHRTCSHISPRLWIFGEAREDCRPPTAPLSRFGPCRLFFFLFPRLKSTPKGRRFQTIEENSLRDLPLSRKTRSRTGKPVGSGVDSGGEYFEGYKS
jgi:hypothetical protein